MAAKQGFLMYYSKGDAIGTRVSVRYRRSGRLSEVVVKRGSTVSPSRTELISFFLQLFQFQDMNFESSNHLITSFYPLFSLVFYAHV